MADFRSLHKYLFIGGPADHQVHELDEADGINMEGHYYRAKKLSFDHDWHIYLMIVEEFNDFNAAAEVANYYGEPR